MKRSLSTVIGSLALLVGLTGCTGSDQPDLAEATTEATSAHSQLLTDHSLDGLSGPEVIAQLDRLPVAQRPADLMASVMPEHLVLSSAETEFAVELPDDEFYLSIAPFVETTHECHYHSLTTCLGELDNRDIHLTITDETGTILVDEQTVTFDNGFTGVWVPDGSSGTIEITYDGLTGTTEFSTDDDAPTCITTLQVA